MNISPGDRREEEGLRPVYKQNSIACFFPKGDFLRVLVDENCERCRNGGT